MAFKKAVKEHAKLRLALVGLAGSGKTFSALKIAAEISRLMRQHGHGDGRIAVIDSERGSASLYADKFSFDVDEMDSFSPSSYAQKIREADRAGYDIIIADSISHAWTGKDGALDQKDRASERSGNSWTAWRDVTPKHNEFVDAMLMCRAHLIVTMRQKMEHVQETVNGKVQIRKVGLASIQREGMEYEFTAVGDLDLTNTLRMSKTRMDGAIAIGDIFEKPGTEFAERAYGWLMSGAAPSAPTPPPVDAPITTAEVECVLAPIVEAAASLPPLTAKLDSVFAKYLADMEAATDLVALDRVATGPGKPAQGTENHKAASAKYLECKAALLKRAAA